MELATLFKSTGSEACVVSALRDCGATVRPYREVLPLMRAIRSQGIDAVVVEDEAETVSLWLGQLRWQSAEQVPLIVHGTGEAASIARALQQGADDYAAAAEGAEMVIQRIQARLILQRRPANTTRIEAFGLVLDPAAGTLGHGACATSGAAASTMRLTDRELALATALFEAQGDLVASEVLAQRVWGRPLELCRRTIEQHVYKLRRKLALFRPLGLHAEIKASYGVGYRLTGSPMQNPADSWWPDL